MNPADLKIASPEKAPEISGGQAEVELSSAEADELALENLPESEKPILDAEKEKTGASGVVTAVVPTQTQVQALEKDQVTIEVEGILEDGLKDIYGKLPDNLKPLFKQKGEETALTISQMIKKTAIKLGEIMKLILSWLKIIPGINRFYLEQEAKIKADKLLVLAEEIKADQTKL